MHNTIKVPIGTSLIRFLVKFLPEVKGKNFGLLRLAEALNKEWPAQIRYISEQGLAYELLLNIIGHRELYFLGKYEPEISWVIDNLFQEGDAVIEAGTDVGIHTVHMAKKVGPRGCVHGFDPLTTAINDTRRHLELNHLNNVILNQMALGEQKGEATIYSFPNWCRGHSSLNNFGKTDTLAQACSVTSIDDYIREKSIHQLKLIKLDIEGSEMSALKGARETILEKHPLVIVEINYETSKAFGYQPGDIIAWFDSLRYSLYVFRQGKWTKLINSEAVKHGDNVLFIWNDDNSSLSILNKL